MELSALLDLLELSNCLLVLLLHCLDLLGHVLVGHVVIGLQSMLLILIITLSLGLLHEGQRLLVLDVLTLVLVVGLLNAPLELVQFAHP